MIFMIFFSLGFKFSDMLFKRWDSPDHFLGDEI